MPTLTPRQRADLARKNLARLEKELKAAQNALESARRPFDAEIDRLRTKLVVLYKKCNDATAELQVQVREKRKMLDVARKLARRLFGEDERFQESRSARTELFRQ